MASVTMKYCNLCGLKNDADLPACRVCGGTLVDASAIENLPEDLTVRFTTSCCPNRECRVSVAQPNTKFCAQCGFKLQPISYELWADKFVEPNLEDNPAQVLLEPSQLLQRALEMGLSKKEAKDRLRTLLEERAGVSWAVLEGWTQQTAALLAKAKRDRAETAQQAAIRRAEKLNITLAVAVSVVEVLARRVITSQGPDLSRSLTVQSAQAAHEAGPVNVTAPRRVRVYKLRKKELAGEKSQLAPLPEDSAQFLYRNLIRESTRSPALTHLNSEGAFPPSGARQKGEIYLIQTARSARAFMPFSDIKGHVWIFPDPRAPGGGRAFKLVLGQLTQKEFEGGKTDMRTMSVRRGSEGYGEETIIFPGASPNVQNRKRSYWGSLDKYLLLYILLGVLGAVLIALLISLRVWR